MSRVVRSAVVAALVWIMAGIPTDAPAQFESGPFAGFALEAWGSGFSMIYDDPNGAIPAHPTGEMHAAYASGTLTDGSGHGVASQFWPGATAATAGPFLEDSVWDNIEEGSDGQFPPKQLGRPALTPRQWPAAAEVFWPGDPHTQDVPPNAHAHSTESLIYSKASTVPLGLPGIFGVDGAATTVQTFVGSVRNAEGLEVEAARSQVVTTVTGITIPTPLGAITIDKVTTTAMATTDGTTPVIEGSTVVSGVTVAGQGYRLDEEGFHQGGETTPNPLLGELNSGLEEALADSGISITLVEPIDTVKAGEGSRSVGGLIIRMKSDRMEDLVSALPEPIQGQVRQNLSTSHDLQLIFGAANVRSSALKAFEFGGEEFEVDLGDDFDAEVLGASVDAVSFDGGDFGSTGGGIATAAPDGGQVVTGRPAFAAPVEVDGVATAALVLGLAFALAVARGLQVVSDRALAPATAGACPIGEDDSE